MKISIEVNMDDMFHEDDETFNETIKSHIVWKVKNDVLKSIEEKVENQITKEIKIVVEKEYELQIRQEVQKMVESGFIPGTQSKDKPNGKLISEWIQGEFKSNNSWNSPRAFLDKKADNFAKEMKTRYDHSFASQVVLKLSQQGLLKDGVIESLMENKN